MRRFAVLLLVAAPFLAAPTIAAASHCAADLPHNGQSFSGPVRKVIDGMSLCLGDGPKAKRWIAVRLADLDAPGLRGPGGEGAKWALRRAAGGKQIVCTAEHVEGRQVLATCTVDGVSLADLARKAAGNGG